MKKVSKVGPRTSSSTTPAKEPQLGSRFSPKLWRTLCPRLAVVVTTNFGLDAPISLSGARRPKGGCKLRMMMLSFCRKLIYGEERCRMQWRPCTRFGFEMVGGEAFSTARHGTKGGVAVLTKTHIQSRVMQHFTVEGCGFCAVEIRVRGVSLLLLSLYLQNSTPLHCHPNAEIVARLVAVIKHHSGQWLIAGDFNLSPQEVADTALVNELGGQLHTVGFPTTHGGSELDFAITSSAVAGLISVELDWSAPHRPHASLCIEFLIPGKQDKALRLLDFPVNEAVAEPCFAASKPGPIPIKIMNLDFSEDPISQKLSSITRWCQDAT